MSTTMTTTAQPPTAQRGQVLDGYAIPGSRVLPEGSVYDVATDALFTTSMQQRTIYFYIWRQNVVAQSVGVSEQQIDAIAELSFENDAFTPAQRAAFVFTAECVRDIEVSGETYALTAKLLSPRQITELLYVIRAYMTICRIGRTGTVVANGKAIFGQDCAACHGTAGGGETGPRLIGESHRKNLAQATAGIENPRLPMPKLYPSTLSKTQVEAVARYVESL